MGTDVKMMYKLKRDVEWIVLQLTPEQYFDDLPPEEEGYDVESVPRFFDVRDYLEERDDSLRDSDITNINVFLRDSEKNTEINFYYTYWNNGENVLIERKDNFPLKSYHEIIIQLTIDRYLCETLRFVEKKRHYASDNAQPYFKQCGWDSIGF